MQLAKKNVEKYFDVVGIMENLNMTLTVAEKKMPQYFKGAKKFFFENPGDNKSLGENVFKLPVSEEVRAIVRKKFTHEIEFYNFCKQRLEAQFKNEI